MSARAVIFFTIGQNFAGSDNSNTLITPADSNGAIGPRHFAEFINGAFAIYNKTNGAGVYRISDTEFWSKAGVTLSANTGVSDPRIIYDPTVQRWFASQVNLDANALDPTTENNDFLLAFSTTSDPTGPWYGVSFVADPEAIAFADFPTLGVDSQAVYLSGDMYFGMNNGLGAALVSIPKADLLASNIANRTWFGVMSYTNRGQVLQPAICFDSSSAGAVLATGDVVSSSDLKFFNVLNAGATNATLTPGTTIPVNAYLAPPNPTQPDGTTTLDDNDARFSAKVYAVNGVLYAVHNIELSGRAAIRWYRINATNHVVLESGTIGDPGLDLFFPAIAANANGRIVITCNGSSITTLVSCYALAGETVNGTTTFGDLTLLKTGAAVYHDIYEQTGITTDSRWGDYSAVSVDPDDPDRFWLIGMVPLDDQTWVTHITELITSHQPPLSIARAGTNVLVSWPLAANGFQLQSTTNLLNTNGWSQVPQTPATNGNQISVLVPASGNQKFFRLRQGP